MSVHQFGTFEAKNKLSALLDLVEQGEEVVITRNGKPVARLVRETKKADKKKKVHEALAWFQENRKNISMDGVTIKELIEEGRK